MVRDGKRRKLGRAASPWEETAWRPLWARRRG
jgi:hypothetical protein